MKTIKEKSTKVIQVCPPDSCDNKAFNVGIKGIKRVFCCEKGFNKSLEEFSAFINKRSK